MESQGSSEAILDNMDRIYRGKGKKSGSGQPTYGGRQEYSPESLSLYGRNKPYGSINPGEISGLYGLTSGLRISGAYGSLSGKKFDDYASKLYDITGEKKYETPYKGQYKGPNSIIYGISYDKPTTLLSDKYDSRYENPIDIPYTTPYKDPDEIPYDIPYNNPDDTKYTPPENYPNPDPKYKFDPIPPPKYDGGRIIIDDRIIPPVILPDLSNNPKRPKIRKEAYGKKKKRMTNVFGSWEQYNAAMGRVERKKGLKISDKMTAGKVDINSTGKIKLRW
jgi:hypothetical protein